MRHRFVQVSLPFHHCVVDKIKGQCGAIASVPSNRAIGMERRGTAFCSDWENEPVYRHSLGFTRIS